MCRLSDQKLLKFQVAVNCKKIVEKYDKKDHDTRSYAISSHIYSCNISMAIYSLWKYKQFYCAGHRTKLLILVSNKIVNF